MILELSFPRNFPQLPTPQCVSWNTNEILSSKDVALDYAYTPEVTSIRNSRKLYLKICDNVSTPKVFKKIQMEMHRVETAYMPIWKWML